MIADVAFDAPVPHPFTYRVPEGWTIEPGQRVVAPLRGAARVGLVLDTRPDHGGDLRPLSRVVDAAPLLTPERLDLVRWIASETLGGIGAAALALLPPAGAAGAGTSVASAAPGGDTGTVVLTGAGRESRLLGRLGEAGGLAVTPDVEGAARWGRRLARLGPVSRLDSGVADRARAAGWTAVAAGAARLAVGTRAALLVPLPGGAALALVDEHDTGHRPPGPPWLHARDLLLERARREGRAAVLTSATPSVELWWRATRGEARLEPGTATAWPAVVVADTRGVARREALTPVLARALRETLGRGGRALLLASRRTAALACDECGAIRRCARCGIALAWTPAARLLRCRLCGEAADPGDHCPGCHGHRLTPFGWSPERVEQSVRRRLPAARVARFDPETRGHAGQAERAAALAADVVVGTRGALRLFGPGALGLAALVSPDQILALPDFRAAERTFALLWAAAERVRAGGTVVVQSRAPDHYAVQALAARRPEAFYGPELEFRGELGYPPFRRIAVVTVRGGTGEAREAAAALRGAGLDVYPPAADRRGLVERIVAKGGNDLPARLRAALGTRLHAGGARPGRDARGIMGVEVDPQAWPF